MTIKRVKNGPQYSVLEGDSVLFTGTRQECLSWTKPVQDIPVSHDEVSSITDLILLLLPENCPTIVDSHLGSHVVNWSANLQMMVISSPVSRYMAENRVKFHQECVL